MDKYKKYIPLIVFLILIAVLIFSAFNWIVPKYQKLKDLEQEIKDKTVKLTALEQEKKIVEEKIKKMQNSIKNSPKKLYYPMESDLGNDTLFFTLYNDIIEMLHANRVKIQSIDYEYNPESDAFVKAGKDTYFVCDVNMELISNYVNLGKFIQDVYQYPYYIKINRVEVSPYPKDKKILFTKLSLRLYAHTSPDDSLLNETPTVSTDKPLNGASVPLPN